MIRTAAELREYEGRRGLAASPASFDGSLQELYDEHIAATMPSPDDVAAFHEVLVSYVASADPLFLIRYVRDTTRGQVYTAGDGSRFKATDNAPAWWTQALAFRGGRVDPAYTREVIETLPVHLFETSKSIGETVASRGWHIAHIFDVKDRHTDWRRWVRRTLTARFIRSVHPCNYFLLPNGGWQRWGGDERVIGFFAALHAVRYGEVWPEFVELAQADPSRIVKISGDVRYSYSPEPFAAVPLSTAASRSVPAVEGAGPVVRYSASRLLFKADVIDGLGDDDVFRVETPAGIFEMTKRDFLAAFPKIPLTKSYREGRVYHFPKIPRAAERFRIG